VPSESTSIELWRLKTRQTCDAVSSERELTYDEFHLGIYERFDVIEVPILIWHNRSCWSRNKNLSWHAIRIDLSKAQLTRQDTHISNALMQRVAAETTRAGRRGKSNPRRLPQSREPPAEMQLYTVLMRCAVQYMPIIYTAVAKQCREVSLSSHSS
jgi:hypothetical protein